MDSIKLLYKATDPNEDFFYLRMGGERWGWGILGIVFLDQMYNILLWL